MYERKRWDNKIENGTQVLLLFKEKPYNVNHHYVTSVLMAIVAVGWLVAQEYLWFEEAFIVTLAILCYLMNLWVYGRKKREATNRREEIEAVVKYHFFNVILFAMGCIGNWQVMFLSSVMVFLISLIFYGAQMSLVAICYREEKFPRWFRMLALLLCLVLTFVPVGILLAMMLLSHITAFALAVPLWLLYFCVGMPLIALNEYEGQNLFEFAFEMTY